MICVIQLLSVDSEHFDDSQKHIYSQNITKSQRIRGVLRYRALQIHISWLSQVTLLHHHYNRSLFGQQNYVKLCMIVNTNALL